MISGKKPKKNSTYRGLEQFTEDNDSDQIIHDCIDVVMDELQRQWSPEDYGTYDWDRFRQISEQVSSQSADLAVQRGDYDACEAHQAYVAMSKEELCETDDDSSVDSIDFIEPPEIPQSLKGFVDCVHPRKLKCMIAR